MTTHDEWEFDVPDEIDSGDPFAGLSWRSGKWRREVKEADFDAVDDLINRAKTLAQEYLKIETDSDMWHVLKSITDIALDVVKLLENQEEIAKAAIDEIKQAMSGDPLLDFLQEKFEEHEELAPYAGTSVPPSNPPDDDGEIPPISVGMDGEGNVYGAQVEDLFKIGEIGCGADDLDKAVFGEKGEDTQVAPDVADRLIDGFLRKKED